MSYQLMTLLAFKKKQLINSLIPLFWKNASNEEILQAVTDWQDNSETDTSVIPNGAKTQLLFFFPSEGSEEQRLKFAIQECIKEDVRIFLMELFSLLIKFDFAKMGAIEFLEIDKIKESFGNHLEGLYFKESENIGYYLYRASKGNQDVTIVHFMGKNSVSIQFLIMRHLNDRIEEKPNYRNKPTYSDTELKFKSQ